MKINIKATNMKLTPAINTYVEEKVNRLHKFIVVTDPESVYADVEIGKTSKHYQDGEVFRAEINVHIAGKLLRAVSEKDDLYAAIDEIKDEAARQINSEKGKERTMTKKGESKLKGILKEFDENEE
ncbi:MAG: ribosomal subunit interface protein [Candidatus Yonathbacteria bacterium CG_4_10_14_3_um_filter_47_65]|uniref:Ribosomal subunit interface protein n=2 Tax=Parcubacteria group TaxID=1794811 RepID=A0A2M8D9F8_9BACT|nr:MAG: ribosomal subunit interface protein [Candidatus Nomurabacteria bacterium CG1_02_47_685]PIP03949.1 MAG: ribosomal subunit interface protein [Candidatus Yonathbacteria bacterium CG23_combo_of_CG06-09_8_20_14_all_46_18]PIQ33244.1 MAG: ribosomal subunit interface protein [Candidatus Yonathbacteria bacterium CG17_big_fil_post_rev_8_21_14_2_50_46_19]PIX56564.1 MAG: ribosomal subunit interface protein [Candidatus Yonathbacteria bacterium CG_4_10_14_3_um_filter_47_65]PIY57439.1 MAG: ribosomal s